MLIRAISRLVPPSWMTRQPKVVEFHNHNRPAGWLLYNDESTHSDDIQTAMVTIGAKTTAADAKFATITDRGHRQGSE